MSKGAYRDTICRLRVSSAWKGSIDNVGNSFLPRALGEIWLIRRVENHKRHERAACRLYVPLVTSVSLGRVVRKRYLPLDRKMRAFHH